jgi:hypothetical protein
LSLVVLLPAPARADWPANGAAVGWAKWFTAVHLESDGPGSIGAFFTGHSQTYAVHTVRALSTSGVPAAAGFGAEGVQEYTDGAGGFYVVALGFTGVTLMHVDAGGAIDPAWGAGAALPTSAYAATAVVPDGVGGVYLACARQTACLQHYDATGAVVAGWPAAGLDLDSAVPSAGSANPAVVVDDQHRAVVLFYDHTNHLVTRRVLPDGTIDPAWSGGSFASYTGPSAVVNLRGLVSSGESYYAWWANYSTAHVTRLDSLGAVAPGWPVTVAAGEDGGGGGPAGPWSQDPERISTFADAAGGLYFYCLPGTAPDTVLATHVRPDGSAAPGWSLPGAPVTLPAIANPVRSGFFAASDGVGGAFYGWNGGVTRFLPTGVLAPGWAPGGDMVAPDSTMRLSTSCSVASVYVSACGVMGDGTGAAILAFTAGDCGYYQNVRVMRFLPAGPAGVSPGTPKITLSVRLAGANPAAGARRFSFALDPAAPAAFEILDVSGRVVSREYVAPGGARERTWSPASARAGVYFARLTQRGDARTLRFVLL